MEPTTSSAVNSSSNGLTKSLVKSTKLLLRKYIEEKTSYTERFSYFNQSLREYGYSPSKFFHRRRVSSYLPTLNDSVTIEEVKVAREQKDLIFKSKKQTHSILSPLKKGDMYYQIKLDGKKETLIHNQCEIELVRIHRESYY